MYSSLDILLITIEDTIFSDSDTVIGTFTKVLELSVRLKALSSRESSSIVNFS